MRVVFFRQGIDMLVWVRTQEWVWLQRMCGYGVCDARCMSLCCVAARSGNVRGGCSPAEASRTQRGSRIPVTENRTHSPPPPPPPQLPMPPTQRYPQGINPYAPPHTAKPQSKSHAAKPPQKQHPPPPHHHLPPPDKHVADSAKVEDFAPPAWRTVLHNRIDFGMYSLCTLGGSSSCSGDRLPRLLSLQTRVRAAGGCAHRGKRQERLRSQAVCLRGGQYSMPDIQAERSCVDRPRHSQCMDLYTSICLEGVSICSCSWARSLSRSRRSPCHSSSTLHASPPRTY